MGQFVGPPEIRQSMGGETEAQSGHGAFRVWGRPQVSCPRPCRQRHIHYMNNRCTWPACGGQSQHGAGVGGTGGGLYLSAEPLHPQATSGRGLSAWRALGGEQPR